MLLKCGILGSVALLNFQWVLTAHLTFYTVLKLNGAYNYVLPFRHGCLENQKEDLEASYPTPSLFNGRAEVRRLERVCSRSHVCYWA